MATYEILRSDELMHYGVLGMKWGVRRYQNKDGSLKSSAKRNTKKKSKFAKAYTRYKGVKKASWDNAVKTNSKHLTRTNIVGGIRIYYDVKAAEYVAKLGRTLYEDARLSSKVRTGAKYVTTAAWAASWYDAAKTGKMMVDANKYAIESEKEKYN